GYTRYFEQRFNTGPYLNAGSVLWELKVAGQPSLDRYHEAYKTFKESLKLTNVLTVQSRDAFGVVVTFTVNKLFQAVLLSYLSVEFLPADALPFFTRNNTLFDGLFFFFRPRQFRI